MKFCDQCENMLYISVKNCSLIYYCKNCNFSVEQDCTSKSVDISIVDDHDKISQYMSKYIKYDKTLPRVNNIKCSCVKSNGQEDEVIYVKYDHANMKYLYYCCHCERFWI